MILRLVSEDDPTFVAFALLCPYVLDAQIDPLRMRAAQPHLNAEELREISIVLAPAGEQREIVSHVRSNLEQFDALSKGAQNSIALLKECRAALIAAAVTGQQSVED